MRDAMRPGLSVDWTKIPIPWGWSLNLNTRLTPIERHAALYFIEHGSMPKTGKRFEWEVCVAKLAGSGESSRMRAYWNAMRSIQCRMRCRHQDKKPPIYADERALLKSSRAASFRAVLREESRNAIGLWLWRSFASTLRMTALEGFQQSKMKADKKLSSHPRSSAFICGSISFLPPRFAPSCGLLVGERRRLGTPRNT